MADDNSPAGDRSTDTEDKGATLVRPRFEFSVEGYQITDILGEGGMGRVYMAWDARLERKVAIKTMTGNISSNADFRARFATEGIIVANLDHANIVRVFGSGETEGTVYIIMQYAPGGSLAERLEKGALEEAEAVEITRSLADALVYSHSLGIIHRDIKPQNILFTADNLPVLSDFGIAKALLSDVQQTATGLVIGDPRYMSPEQIMGEADEKTDVYNLGLVLYEMLCGKPPEKAFKTIHSDDSARQLQQSLPTGLKKYAKVLTGCLYADPQQRLSAQQLVTQLDTLRSSGTSSNGALLAAILVLSLVTSGYLTYSFFSGDAGQVVQQQLVSVALSLEPESSRLYIDGQNKDTGSELLLAPGRHQAIAVAQGHEGVYQEIEVSADSNTIIELHLATLGRPSDREFLEKFSPYILQKRVEGVPQPVFKHETFNRLTRIKALATTPGEEEALKAKVTVLEKLAMKGDEAAQTLLFYATYKEWIGDDTTRYLAGLEDASRNNYVLATVYLCLYFIDTQTDRMMIDSAARTQVLSLLSVVENQGMPETAARLRANLAM